MQPKYYVTRTFKAGGLLFLAGTLLNEITNIRLHKIRLNEGKIKPFPSEGPEREKLSDYYRDRFSLNLEEEIQKFEAKTEVSAEQAKKAVKQPTPGTPNTNVAATPATQGIMKPKIIIKK